MIQDMYNGKFYNQGAAIFGADSRGLRYGDGLFETMKSNECEVEFLDEHLARLWAGMRVLQFELPKQFTPDKMQQDITTVLQKNKHLQMARVRLTICRGDGGLYDAVNHKPNYIIQSWPLGAETGSWNSNGLIAGLYTEVKKSFDILSNIKHNNFLPYSLAAMYAKQQKWNDAILFNSNNTICDTTIANIFLIKAGVIYTPALADGCISGIMRKHLIEMLKKSGTQVVEGSLRDVDLFEADEVFLTNSIHNMRWVQQVEDKKYTHKVAQEIYMSVFPTK